MRKHNLSKVLALTLAGIMTIGGCLVAKKTDVSAAATTFGLYIGGESPIATVDAETTGTYKLSYSGDAVSAGDWGTMYFKQTSTDAGKTGFGVKIDSIKLNSTDYDVPAKWQGVSADAENKDGLFDIAFYNQWGDAAGNIGDGTGKDLGSLAVTDAEVTFTIAKLDTFGLYIGGESPIATVDGATGTYTIEYSGDAVSAGDWGTMYFKQTNDQKHLDGSAVKIESISLNGTDYPVPEKWQSLQSSAVTDDGLFDIAFYNQWGDAAGNIGDGTGKDLGSLQVTEAKITFTVVSNTEAVALGGDTSDDNGDSKDDADSKEDGDDTTLDDTKKDDNTEVTEKIDLNKECKPVDGKTPSATIKSSDFASTKGVKAVVVEASIPESAKDKWNDWCGNIVVVKDAEGTHYYMWGGASVGWNKDVDGDKVDDIIGGVNGDQWLGTVVDGKVTLTIPVASEDFTIDFITDCYVENGAPSYDGAIYVLDNASLSATAQKPGNGDKPLGDTVMIFVAVAALAACVAVTARKTAVEK